MNNLAYTFNFQGYFCYAEAKNLNEHVLEIRRKVLGDEHPDTLTSMHNLASVLSFQGYCADAKELDEYVLEIRRKVLGDEHPDTLSSMNNLAYTLRNHGDYAGARKFYEQVLNIMRKALGDEHPDTSTSAWNLYVTLLNMGEPDAANDIMKKHLIWLIDSDPMYLAAELHEIRERVIQIIGEKNRVE